MYKKHLLLLVLLITSFPLFAQTYITNVSIADVKKQKILPNQTVIITNDIITDILSNKKVKVPLGAIVLDGSGKYLFPGLTDAHMHFFQSGGLYTRPDAIDLRKDRPYHKEIDYSHQNMENVMLRYVQNGITNIIDVGGTYNLLKQKELYKDEVIAPSIYMTGPLLTTYMPTAYKDLKNDNPFSLVKTAEDGVNMVQEQLPYNPDFIKIWFIVGVDGLTMEESARKSLPIIKAIIMEAHRNNLKVAVHSTQQLTARLAVENGCDFLVHSVEDEVLKDDFVQLMKKNKTILCPTLAVYDGYINTLGQNVEKSKHELQKADAFQLGTLLDLKHLSDTLLINNYKNRFRSKTSLARFNKRDSIMSLNLKILTDAGVLIATGTDAGNIGTLHASSYLAELKAMHKSGMSNWDIITASTLNGAKVLGKENDFGTISIGKKASLILLNANPIDNIENITNISMVINNGKAISPNEILQDSPTDLAQRQLNAYNLRNIDAFLEPYAEDVEIYNYPDKLRYKGKEAMRSRYSKMFETTSNLHCELVDRIVQGNIVIDKERVQFGDKIIEAIAIYHIEHNKIKKVYFVQ